ncbi:MAG: gliding motility-associated ABC transporter substrate-binding protein GldG [Candidatus Symbiothrix sp.]|jgi:ABC-2 type transport system permease protein|nr:gliding motility-associated ABC transporter substrate-binding protein GldG [Candidatus Symbiothrix sp.]
MYKQWMTLVSKELRFNLYSLSGIIFMLLFLIVCGCMLWLIPGGYNIPENGYASLSAFFSIAPVLFLFLIPALSMRSFSEEKRMHTLTLLQSRPVTMQAIVSAKITALFVTVAITLLPTLVYAGSIYFYGIPVGNLDLGAVAASYTGLLFLVLAFICLSVFASSLTSNQVIALIIGMLLCVFFYFGFDLLGLKQLSFLSHYQSVQRGLIESRDLCYFLAVAVVFANISVIAGLTRNPLRTVKHPLTISRGLRVKPAMTVVAVLFLIILGLIFNFRLDCTQDQRYTIRPVSKKVLQTLDAPLDVEIYLTGNLNPGFARLQESVLNLLSDFDKLSPEKITQKTVDPYRQSADFIERLKEEGIRGVAVNEKITAGKTAQNIIFPYALLKQKDRQIPVPLLVNQMGRSGEDNLNLSVEMLEYQFAHAIQLLTQKQAKRIVFLEGHGELPETSVSEMTDELSYEYTIDRGTLSGRPGELDAYDLVIIAGPQSPFSEADKFVLDQYLMQGGSLLWLTDGIQLHSYSELAQTGETITRANDLNLNDLFFTYGLRINPVILQDVQSLNIPVATTNDSNQTDYVSKPWYYAALLIPNNVLEITKGLSLVKTEFASTISFVGDNPLKNKAILLSSSQYTHTVPVPAMISLEETDRLPDKNYFNEQYLPVAVLLQPPFSSAFKNRVLTSVPADYTFLSESDPAAQMIVAASEEIINNPLGYDRYSQTQFANREFILNAVNYLTDNTGVSTLKNKSLQLQLLNKAALQEDRTQLIFVNIILPPLMLLSAFIILSVIRKRKYTAAFFVKF